jgi:hypothetical protein
MGLYDTLGQFYDSGVLYDAVSPPPLERKRMAKVKLALKGLTRDQLADKGDTNQNRDDGQRKFSEAQSHAGDARNTDPSSDGTLNPY